MNHDKNICCPEIGKLAVDAMTAARNEKEKEDFIAFLFYCSDRLRKGAPVQLIWHDFQEIRG